MTPPTNINHILDNLFGWESVPGADSADTPNSRLLETLDGSLNRTPTPEDEQVDCRDMIRELEEEKIKQARQTGQLLCRKAKWPRAANFAAMLSHDIDQIHDRELFRWLGDINHLRRHWFKGERGLTGHCLRRILRPLFKPINPMLQFTAMREIEKKHGWKSTFFLLEDDYWRKKGGRFNWEDASFRKISDFLLEDGCEYGIHGSAYHHADPSWWERTQERFAQLYGEPARGSRIHHLKLSLPRTWQAQQGAGLLYDTTLGYPNRLGAPAGFCFPFQAATGRDDTARPFYELPLSIMDQTLFRYLGLNGDGAFEKGCELLEQIIDAGGLAVLLWHNNFFAEEEYAEWQETYERLLDWLSPHQPWVATGREIAEWWHQRQGVQLLKINEGRRRIVCRDPIDNLTIEFFGTTDNDHFEGDAPFEEKRRQDYAGLTFPHLTAGARVEIQVRRQ